MVENKSKLGKAGNIKSCTFHSSSVHIRSEEKILKRNVHIYDRSVCFSFFVFVKLYLRLRPEFNYTFNDYDSMTS